MIQKINTFLAALTITATTVGMLPANAYDNSANAASTEETTGLPRRVDLSKDENSYRFFPEIGNQGSTNSCAYFAGIYYQFTNEMRKAYFEKYGVIPDFVCSPEFIFNRVNYGENRGTDIQSVYGLLREIGCLTTDDAPFVVPGPGRPEEFDFDHIETRAEQLCKALKMRLVDFHPITAYNLDNRMRLLKEQLNNGKIVVTNSWFDDMPDYIGTTKGGEKILLQNIHKSSSSGHNFVIVGYDDDLEYTYNGNTYKGAFKIANSWYETNEDGTEWSDTEKWGNDGFMWVAYDSLREKSEIGLTCEVEGYKRVPGLGGKFFSEMTIGHTIDVELKDIKLIAEASVDAAYLSGISIETTDMDDPRNSVVGYGESRNKKKAYKGSVVSDIDEMCVGDYFTDKKYKISVYSGYNDNNLKTVYSVSLRDDLGNEVAKTNVEAGKTEAVVELDLQRGDIDYDGEITLADRDMLREYVNCTYGYEITENKFSTLQKELMDVNDDKKVTVDDLDIIEDRIDVLYWLEDGKYIGTQTVNNLSWNEINGDWYFLDWEGKKVTDKIIYDATWNGNFYVDNKGRCVMNKVFTYGDTTYRADENGYLTEV